MTTIQLDTEDDKIKEVRFIPDDILNISHNEDQENNIAVLERSPTFNKEWIISDKVMKKQNKSTSRSKSRNGKVFKRKPKPIHLMKSWSEIKLCWLTNQIRYSHKEEPYTPSDMTRYYNELVQSDFSNITKGAGTFCKEPRFKENSEGLPGPGYYNPQNRKLSNYSKSKVYDDIYKRMDSFDCPKSFNLR